MRDDPGTAHVTEQRLAHALGRGRDRPDGWVPGRADGWPVRAAEQLADRVPAAWRGARWAAPGRAVGAALALVLVVAGVAVARTSILPGSQAVELPARVGAAPAATGTPPLSALPTTTPGGVPATPSAAELVVDVVGRVHSPGVVRLPAGARVQDAITKAGGATRSADLAAVNLARPLVDGEQIVVPRPGQRLPAAAPLAPGGAAGASPAPAVLDLNAATGSDLDALPGIGPVLAQRILTLRQQRGRFGQVEELTEVAGIGDHLMTQLRPLVRV